MSSLSSIVAADGALRQGDQGSGVLSLQIALAQAGYRVGQDGDFGSRTASQVARFQQQHGLKSDGVLGPLTAALLDAPHQILIETALAAYVPAVSATGLRTWPHDDTASLQAFYGKPWQDSSLITHVSCPWTLYYEGREWPHPVQFHVKAAPALAAAFAEIWEAAGKDNASALLKHVRAFSGSGEYRPIRGSSRLSCHAFWAAIDNDSEHLPLGHGVPDSEMPSEIVQAFKHNGAFWGGDYTGRKDPMHFQWAHE